jgi:2-polyprenyl-3-methyl-5-hydroxy-6-metoxy-1,4-benzoquinol methylase
MQQNLRRVTAVRAEALHSGFIGNIDSVDNETVGGWIADPSNPHKTFEVDLYLDGLKHARLRAGFPRPDVCEKGFGSGNNGFFFQLPAAHQHHLVDVEVKEVQSEALVGKAIRMSRVPSPQFAGLTAETAALLIHKPLLGTGSNAISFSGNILTLEGHYMPPGGDPFSYAVIGEEGVTFELHTAIGDQNPREYFWFWPNAQWSKWRIKIILALTNHKKDYYRFVFRPHNAAPGEKDDILVVPKDLSVWENLPGEAGMNRVQLYDFPEASPIRAASHCSNLIELGKQHGCDFAQARILDWGCGWGRLARAFARLQPSAEFWGADVDALNLEWADQNVRATKFVQLPLTPPSALPEDYFDLVYGVSVMTHLTREMQGLWLEELRRIMRPGGIALLTFHGRTALGYSTRYLHEKQVENFMQAGFDDSMECTDLDSVIGTGYYKNTYQTFDDVLENWGKIFEVLTYREAFIGFQDIAVLRKR